MDEKKKEPAPLTGDASAALELVLEERDREFYVLRLYISGMTPRSRQAIKNIHKICDDHLKERYQLEIIDIYQNPQLAKERQIIALPVLVKELPLPLRRFVGDLSKMESILIGMNRGHQG